MTNDPVLKETCDAKHNELRHAINSLRRSMDKLFDIIAGNGELGLVGRVINLEASSVNRARHARTRNEKIWSVLRPTVMYLVTGFLGFLIAIALKVGSTL